MHVLHDLLLQGLDVVVLAGHQQLRARHRALQVLGSQLEAPRSLDLLGVVVHAPHSQLLRPPSTGPCGSWGAPIAERAAAFHPHALRALRQPSRTECQPAAQHQGPRNDRDAQHSCQQKSAASERPAPAGISALTQAAPRRMSRHAHQEPDQAFGADPSRM